MRTRERAALVALLRPSGADPQEIVLDILDEGSAVAVLRRRMEPGGESFTEGGVAEAIEDAEGLLAEWSGEGIGVHAFFDDGYPPQLRDIHQVPPLLFSRGDRRPDVRAIAVVGARRAGARGRRIATAVARTLARDGVTVVSGLAACVETAVHWGALVAGGRTVAVIGTGIGSDHPPKDRALLERIARTGLVISPCWPGAPPSRQSLSMRNAVISGYAAATVVVEAPRRGGGGVQARLALQHGRPVMLPRELLGHAWARDYAGRPGVHVVRDLAEMLAVANELIDDMTVTPGGLPALTWD